MRSFLLIMAAFSFALVIPSLVSAASNSYGLELSCRIDFNIAIMNSMISVAPTNSSALQTSVTTLTNDKAQLLSITNSSAYKAFDQQYAADMKQVRQSVSDWRKNVQKDLSLSAKATLISSYSQAITTFSQCRFSSLQTMAQDRVNNYKTSIANFQNASNRLSSRGFDTSTLNTLLTGAQNQIVQPLQNAISAANDSLSLEQALKSYCLFNGCANGTNFHLDAKFDWTRFNIVFQSLQNNSVTFKLNATLLSQASQSLSDAQTTLNAVGTAVYAPGQSQTIFADLKSTSQAISGLLKQIEQELNPGLK